MSNTAKIAISLPKEVLSMIERERSESGESRSQFLLRAVESYLRERRDREADQQYVRAYRDMPETEEEVKAAAEAARLVLAKEPW